MGSIACMDPKSPSSCWYMSRPPPQPIGQNRVFKFERHPPLSPSNITTKFRVFVLKKLELYKSCSLL